MEKIKLLVQGNSWVAYSDDPQIEELFGSPIIPTAFMASVSGDVVLREMKKLNPQAEVSLQIYPRG